MVPLGNNEGLRSANKEIEKLLKEGGGAAGEEKVEVSSVGEGAEGGVADALDQEEINENLADMTPQDIEDLREIQSLWINGRGRGEDKSQNQPNKPDFAPKKTFLSI